jgi:hypothetical protein
MGHIKQSQNKKEKPNNLKVFGSKEIKMILMEPKNCLITVVYIYYTEGDINSVFTYMPPDKNRITVVAGDRIGWYVILDDFTSN